MKKHIVTILLLFVVLLAACSEQHTKSPTEGITKTTETALDISENIAPTNDETVFFSPDLFPILHEEKANYKLFTGDQYSGYYYEIYTNQGELMDYGYCSWKFSKLEYVEDALLTLEVSSGGPFFNAKYFDVENGRVSKAYSSPVGNSDNFVAYFSQDDTGTYLVVGEIFLPKNCQKFYDDSFDIGIYTTRPSAEFSNDETSVTITYYSVNADEYLTKTFTFQ